MLKKTAYDDTKKTYATYTSGDVKDKSSYAYQQKQYQDALGKYKNYLDDKTSFDTSKGDVYNTYKTAYQDRIAQTPMYLQQQFTRASDVNPYEGMYSPYGSVDNYNKTGTYWNDVIGDPTYTGAYTPYTPLYKQKGFADQASYEATLPVWKQQGFGSELQYLDYKNSQDSIKGAAGNDGLTKVPSTIVDTKVPSTITGAVGNDTLTSIIGKDSLTGAVGNDTLKSVIGNDSLTGANTLAEYIRRVNIKNSFGSRQAMNDYFAANPDDNPDLMTPFSVANTTPSLTDLAVKNDVSTTPSSQQQLEDQAVNAGYQGDYTDTAAMQDFLNARNTNVPSLTDLAIKNGVANTGTQQISNTTPADKTTASLVSQPGVMQQAAKPAWLLEGFDSEDDYNTYYYAKGGSVHDLYRKYANGGRVAHYADAGYVDIADKVMPRPEQGIPQPIEAPAPIAVQAPPQSDSMVQMQEMLKAYGTPSNDYAQELEDARRKSNAETEAFMSMIQKSRKPENDNLSQAELYFRLAAAAGAPTKTGGIAESLSNINREMSDYSKEQVGRRNSDLELQMKAQQLKAANAKEDLNTLRSLSSEDKKTRREMISNMIKAEIESGKPQSELAKLAKDRYGYGTPEYYSFMEKNTPQWVASKMAQMQMGPITAQGQLAVAQGNYVLNQEKTDIAQKEFTQKTEDREQKKNEMSQPELKMKTDFQDQITTLENAASKIQRAYKLNANSFGNTPMEQVKRKELELTVGDKDTKVKNTRELETFLGSTVLDIAQDLKGSISDSDTKMLNKMTGAQALGTDERADVLYENWSTLQKRIALKKKQLEDVENKRARAYNQNDSEQ